MFFRSNFEANNDFNHTFHSNILCPLMMEVLMCKMILAILDHAQELHMDHLIS